MFFQIAEEHQRLENKLLDLRANTAEGALAKLQYVLSAEQFEDDLQGNIRGGTCMSMPLSAMRDAAAILSGLP